jgi:2,5-diketo-D-gluconate reductase A
LEELYEAGKLRAIGISNFYTDRMVEFTAFNRVKPMVNQVEMHIFNQQAAMFPWAEKYGVRLEAWAPFGEGRKGTFENPVVAQIAAKHGKTPAQVMLRWLIQRGVVVIPKTTHIQRMAENLDVFDFALTPEDMAAIAALDTQESSFFSHQDPAIIEWFVQMVEVRKNQHDSTKEEKAW